MGRRIRLVGPADDFSLPHLRDSEKKPGFFSLHRCRRAIPQVRMSFATAVPVAIAIAVTVTNYGEGVSSLPSGIGIGIDDAIAPMMDMLGYVVCVNVSLSQIRRILWSLKDPPFRTIRFPRYVGILRLEVRKLRGFSTIDAVNVCQGESPSVM